MEMRDWLILGAFVINVLGIVFACGMGWQVVKQMRRQMDAQEIRFQMIEGRLPDLNKVEILLGVLRDVVEGLQQTLRNGLSAQLSDLRTQFFEMRARCEERHNHHEGCRLGDNRG